MGKKISKVLALLFIFVTTLGGALSAHAAEDAIRPDKGNLTIHKYWAETAADVFDEGDGTEQTSGPNNPVVKGIQFDVYLLEKIGSAPDTPPSDKDGWTYTKKTDEDVLIVKDDTTTYQYSMSIQVADNEYSDGKTGIDGVLKYSNLPAGYYYVEENLKASAGYQVQGTGNEGKIITSPSKPFIVAVPMTRPEGTEWNPNVHVYPKNQGLNPEKKPDKPSVNVGEVVEWTITTNIPTDIATYSRFDISDELDKRLNFVFQEDKLDESVTVQVLDAAGTVIDSLAKTTEYTVTRTAASGENKEKIVISLTKVGIDKLASTDGVVKLAVSFKTLVNGNIDSDLKNVIENEANIEFENDSTTEIEKIPTPPSKVNTGEILIDKKDSNGLNPLQGSEFKLASSSTNATNGNFLKVKLDANNKYIIDILDVGDPDYNTDKAIEWVVRPHAEAKDLGVNNKVFYAGSFEGLQTHTISASDGSTIWNSYFIVETKAPQGYNLLGSPVEVTFVSELTNYVLSQTVINKRGFTLPNTGGIGTVILVIAGIVLIGLAVILIISKNKKYV